MSNDKKVVFLFFKEAFTQQTDKAQLIILGNPQNPYKVWLPLSQIEIRESVEQKGMNVVILPEWLFEKKVALHDFTDSEYYNEKLSY